MVDSAWAFKISLISGPKSATVNAVVDAAAAGAGAGGFAAMAAVLFRAVAAVGADVRLIRFGLGPDELGAGRTRDRVGGCCGDADRNADRAGNFRSSSESTASSPPDTSVSSPDVMSNHRCFIHAFVRWCMGKGSHSDHR
jgi:hypothetical protein